MLGFSKVPVFLCHPAYITFTIPGIYRIVRLKLCRNKENPASPKECETQAFAIKARTNIEKYVNTQIILLFTALNTVKGEIDVIPERNGNISSWIRVERTDFIGLKVQTVHKNGTLQQTYFRVEYYRSTDTTLCRQLV